MRNIADSLTRIFIQIPLRLAVLFRVFHIPKNYILIISPTYFGRDSVVGGGERYPIELAKALASKKRVRFVSFGNSYERSVVGALEVVVYKPHFPFHRNIYHPFNLSLIRDIWSAEVIQCAQYRTLTTFVSLGFAKLFGKKTFVSDYGYGSNKKYLQWFHAWVNSFLLLSRFGTKMIPAPSAKKKVVWGGVDLHHFKPIPFSQKKEYLLYVGRIMPHKGIDVIVRAIKGEELVVIGTVYHERYYQDLQKIAKGKKVRFLTRVEDRDLVRFYQEARASILSSVQKDVYGTFQVQPELFGLVLLESMASGTPVIASKVGGIPEIVRDQKDGILVDPGNVKQMRRAILSMYEDRALWEERSKEMHHHIEVTYSWSVIAERYLRYYEKA